MKFWFYFLLSGMLLLGGCSRGGIIVTTRENPAADYKDTAGDAVIKAQEDASGDHTTAAIPETEAESGQIAVYVCGAVENPDVYYLSTGARAVDAIQMAGGFSADADREWVNLAGTVRDGQMLQIPTLDETRTARENRAELYISDGTDLSGYSLQADSIISAGGSSSGSLSPGQNGRININTASEEELMLLSGIGSAKAKEIIAYRESCGGFTDISQIKQVHGIGDKLFEKIKNEISIQ